MKVLMLSRFYYPHIGGVETHVKGISKILQRNLEISVLTEKFDRSLKKLEIVDGTKVYRFNYQKIKFIGLFGIWMELFKRRKMIQNSDIIHCHDVFIWYLPFRIIYPKKPVFITFHGFEKYPVSFKDCLYKKIAERLTKGSLCIGDFVKKYNKLETNNVSYGAVDTTIFKKSTNDFVYDLIYWGRVGENTNIKLYLKTVSMLNKNKRFKFMILGDSDNFDIKNPYIFYKKAVSNPVEYINKSRYVFAGGYLSVLEAFSCKKLVFAIYDNPLRKDYYLKTPFKNFIVCERSPERLANKLQYYSKNPQEITLKINKAYYWVVDQNWENLANNYLKMWKVN
jgi:glycosyltransferase involved in cell wall biosynthesis